MKFNIAETFMYFIRSLNHNDSQRNIYNRNAHEVVDQWVNVDTASIMPHSSKTSEPNIICENNVCEETNASSSVPDESQIQTQALDTVRIELCKEEMSSTTKPKPTTTKYSSWADIDEESYIAPAITKEPNPKPEFKSASEKSANKNIINSANQKRDYRRVIVFDVEATGLLPKHVYGQPFPPDHLYPHILQLSYIVYDLKLGKIVDQMNEYARIPDNIPITKEVTNITGITLQTIKTRGKPVAPLLLRFYDALTKCDAAIAHNIQYDRTVIRKEIYRNKAELKRLTCSPAKVDDMVRSMTEKFFEDRKMRSVCTMMSTIQLCDLWYVPQGSLPTIDANGCAVDPAAKRKMPKLSELYECLFEEKAPEGLHDAIVDVQVCLKCFLEINRREKLAQQATQVAEEAVNAAVKATEMAKAMTQSHDPKQ